jgi:hypothetical protein
MDSEINNNNNRSVWPKSILLFKISEIDSVTSKKLEEL